mgnify:CR=1 FL=1
MKKSKILYDKKGFTVVELMIATLVFSLVLLIAMGALIQMSKLYYKGITNARTQELSRNVMANISQGIQFSRQTVIPPSLNSTNPAIAIVDPPATEITNTTGFFCVGPKRYSYVLDRKLSLNPDASPVASRKKESRHVLWVDTPANGCAGNLSPTAAVMSQENPCAALINACSDGVELMIENTRLTRISLVESSAGSRLWAISIGVAYGDDDLLVSDGTRYVCEGSISVSQFCGISELSSTVLRRL